MDQVEALDLQPVRNRPWLETQRQKLPLCDNPMLAFRHLCDPRLDFGTWGGFTLHMSEFSPHVCHGARMTGGSARVSPPTCPLLNFAGDDLTDEMVDAPSVSA
jgi:hypothetical protein